MKGIPFSEWPEDDEDVQYLLNDFEVDENGPYLLGSSMAPLAENSVFLGTKFYIEPLGLLEDPKFNKIISLYKQFEKGALTWSEDGPLTKAAIDAIILFSDTLELCRAAWQKRMLERKK